MTTHSALEFSHRLDQLLISERGLMVEFIVELAEFDRRELWVELGYRSLFDYLTRALRLSESSAYYRITAAALVRRFPAALAELRDGNICITNLVKLRDVLTEQNCESLLAEARGKPKREIETLVATFAPLPARRDVVCAMPAPLPMTFEQATTPAAPTEPALVPPMLAPIKPDLTESLSRELHRLHITVSSEFIRDLEEAKAAINHKGPRSLEAILGEGLRLILKEHRKRKALTARPRTQTPRPAATGRRNERYIPAEVRRAVWTRDNGRCQWPLLEGGVCDSNEQIEYDHRHAHARGGKATVENLRLLCHTHNLLAAEKTFGAVFMKRAIGTSID